MRYGPAAAPAWGQSLLWWEGGAAALAVAGGLWVVLSHRRGIALMTTGVLIKGNVLAKFIPWQDIAGISYHQETSAWQFAWQSAWRFAEARIWLQKGAKITLNSLVSPKKLPECVTHLKAEIYTRQETICRHNLQSGQRIAFGPLLLHQTGMGLTGLFVRRFLTWTEIEQIEVVEGQLILDWVKNRRVIPVGSIPNFEIFLALAREAEKSTAN